MREALEFGESKKDCDWLALDFLWVAPTNSSKIPHLIETVLEVREWRVDRNTNQS
jgi:hypothetical protein